MSNERTSIFDQQSTSVIGEANDTKHFMIGRKCNLNIIETSIHVLNLTVEVDEPLFDLFDVVRSVSRSQELFHILIWVADLNVFNARSLD